MKDHPPQSPGVPASLEDLRQRARSPEGQQADIDALVEALRRPVWPGQDVSGRAEVLQLIIEDPVLGERRDSSGQRVDGAAVRALMSMGRPASTLSAAGRKALLHAPSLVLPRKVEKEGEMPQEVAPWKKLAAGFFLLAGVGAFLFPLVVDTRFIGWVTLIFGGFLLVTLILPALSLLVVFKDPSVVYGPLTGIVAMAVGASFLMPLLVYFFVSGDSPGMSGLFMVGYPLAFVHGGLALCLLISALEKRRGRVTRSR